MKTVLFVCIHNSGRSQMAEAFFNKMAKGTTEALSAGTQPAKNINAVMVEAMREVGIDISGNMPKALTLDIAERADRVITMGCGIEAEAVCPASFVGIEDWALEDPSDKTLEQVRGIRDEIQERVAKLIGEISLKQ